MADGFGILQSMQNGGRVVTMQSSPDEKIRLFRAMFCGREDVFAERWESKTGKAGYKALGYEIVMPLSTASARPRGTAARSATASAICSRRCTPAKLLMARRIPLEIAH